MNIKQKCLVVKIGSNTVTSGTDNLDKSLLSNLAAQVSALFKKGWKIVIVSSGSVALGKPRMKNYDTNEIVSKQRAAARGQPLLMSGWREAFTPFKIETDQLLFNKTNFAAHINVLNAIVDGVVICNGDDTGNEPGIEKTVIYEDNDDLAADIAVAIKADIIVYLTDVSGILDANGKVITDIEPNEDLSRRGVRFNGKNSKGTGGLESKHKFASIAAQKGVLSFITKGTEKDCLLKISEGERIGTAYSTKSRRKN